MNLGPRPNPNPPGNDEDAREMIEGLRPFVLVCIRRLSVPDHEQEHLAEQTMAYLYSELRDTYEDPNALYSHMKVKACGFVTRHVLKPKAD